MSYKGHKEETIIFIKTKKKRQGSCGEKADEQQRKDKT